MGRLIDADKLMAEMKKVEAEPAYQHTGEDWYVGMVSAEGFVDEAETADAIPVEWIKSQIPKSEEFYATLISIILLQLINKYHEEQQGDTQ